MLTSLLTRRWVRSKAKGSLTPEGLPLTHALATQHMMAIENIIHLKEEGEGVGRVYGLSMCVYVYVFVLWFRLVVRVCGV